MGGRRKAALKRLKGLARQVRRHVQKVIDNPGHPSLNHYKHEARNWVRQMEEALRHAGKKTAAKWQERLEQYKGRLEA